MLDRLIRWVFPSLFPPEPAGRVSVAEPEEDDSLLARFNRNGHRCPDCAGDLLTGPEGGCSVNVKCDACGHEFNVAIAFGEAMFVERIRWTTP